MKPNRGMCRRPLGSTWCKNRLLNSTPIGFLQAGKKTCRDTAVAVRPAATNHAPRTESERPLACGQVHCHASRSDERLAAGTRTTQSEDSCISLKKQGGPTHRIELVRQPVGKRFWIRRDGKPSSKVPEATASQIAERIRRWLVSNSLTTGAIPSTVRFSTIRGRPPVPVSVVG